jgi:hypothetical protein
MNNIFNILKNKVFFKQRVLEIQNSPTHIKKFKERIRINNGSIIDKKNCKLYSMDTKSFKIIYPNLLNLKEIERLETIENWALIQTLRKENILLKKSYMNEFSITYEEK